MADDNPWAMLFENSTRAIVEAERCAESGNNDQALKAIVASVQALISEATVLLDDLHDPSSATNPPRQIGGQPVGLTGLLLAYVDHIGDAKDVGLPWNEYLHLPPVYIDGEPEYPIEVLAQCRGCGRPSFAYGQIEADRSISVMSAGSHPEPRTGKCGDKIPALMFAFREVRDLARWPRQVG